MMRKGEAAADPAEYLARLSGWQRELVIALRAALLSAADFEEAIKWTNVVYLAEGPCILIRSEERRVLLGFWRGKRLVELDPRIKPSGKYELGNIAFGPDTPVDIDRIKALAARAHELNRVLGDPARRR